MSFRPVSTGLITLKCPVCGREQQVSYEDYKVYSSPEYHGYTCYCSAKMIVKV